MTDFTLHSNANLFSFFSFFYSILFILVQDLAYASFQFLPSALGRVHMCTVNMKYILLSIRLAIQQKVGVWKWGSTVGLLLLERERNQVSVKKPCIDIPKPSKWPQSKCKHKPWVHTPFTPLLNMSDKRWIFTTGNSWINDRRCEKQRDPSRK